MKQEYLKNVNVFVGFKSIFFLLYTNQKSSNGVEGNKAVS